MFFSFAANRVASQTIGSEKESAEQDLMNDPCSSLHLSYTNASIATLQVYPHVKQGSDTLESCFFLQDSDLAFSCCEKGEKYTHVNSAFNRHTFR